MVPPDQFYTDEILVGVLAGANDNGSLYSNMGLSHVRVHFEGTIHEIAAPTHAELIDANGNARVYFGWWVKLRKPASLSGEGRVYFEAVPSDASMQARVIGPYGFHATDQLHDFSLEIAASPPEIVGQRYKTISAAFAYLRVQSANNPLVTITEAGDYVLGNAGTFYGGKGYCTITATQPIRIVNAPTTASFIAYRPLYNGLRFRGANVTVDFAAAQALYWEVTTTQRQHWFDGCLLVNSDGRDSLLRNAPAGAMGYLAGGTPILTECTASDLSRIGQNASLVRGCVIERSWNDLFNGCPCVVHNEIVDHDSSWFRSDHLAMTLGYSGPAATATIEGSGYRTFTAKEDGVAVGSFTVSPAHANWLAGTNFKVSNVVDWINNDLPAGWSATLVDDTRQASQLSTAGGLGRPVSVPVDVKTAPIELFCSWDIHADIYQKQNTSSIEENLLVAFNTGIGLNAQDIFLVGAPGINDMLVFNNAFANDLPVPDRSQLSSPHSHVVVAHNSLSTQPFLVRNDLNYAADSYCLFANNVVPGLSLEGGPATDLTFSGNHVQTADSKTPVGTTSGGTAGSLFTNASAGNFTPKGDLLAYPKQSTVPIDLLGLARANAAPAGAVA